VVAPFMDCATVSAVSSTEYAHVLGPARLTSNSGKYCDGPLVGFMMRFPFVV